MIKIISGWTDPGGSTVANINLCNMFNEHGHECLLAGPHDWHMDKCNGVTVTNDNAGALFQDLTDEDILICHFVPHAPKPPNVGMMVLSCHETDIYPVRDFPYKQYDVIHYVSNYQKGWHKVNHPSVIIPNIVDKVKWTAPGAKLAGVIGSLDAHKQPHLAVKAALEAGYNKVLLFGKVTNINYFNTIIWPLIQSGKVKYLGHVDNKEKMYGSLDAVYHSSKRETFGLVRAECELAGIPFVDVGDSSEHEIEIIDREEIYLRWKKLLKLSDSSCLQEADPKDS